MMNNSNGLILATLGGIALGATAGLLLAPKSGKETRKDISDKIDLLKDQIAEFASEGSDFASKKIDELKEKLEEIEKEIGSTETA